MRHAIMRNKTAATCSFRFCLFYCQR